MIQAEQQNLVFPCLLHQKHQNKIYVYSNWFIDKLDRLY